MLFKTIRLAFGAVAVGCFAWAGCSSDETTPATQNDAGTSNTDASVDPPTPPAADASSRVLGPGEVELRYGTCPAATPCGGDPVGTWTYTEGGCVAELTTALCPALVLKETFVKAKGTITIGATSFRREITALTQATVELPKSCAQGFACSFVGIFLKGQPPQGAGFDVADCVDGTTPDTCLCTVERRVSETTEDDYTVNGSTITLNTGATYDFCVEGNKMTYRDRFQNLVDANIVMSK